MDQAQVASKPSGLPRPSRLPTRLPVLAKTTSTNSLSLQQELPPPSRPGADRLRLPTKKPSVPSLGRTIPEPRVTVPTPRRTGISGIRPGAATPSRSARSIPARPPSRLRRPPPASVTQNPTRESEEHHDQLGSLDGFRAASRQGFYEDAEPEEYVEPAPELPTLKTKKPSRPSLSDRTIESLQSVPSTPKERRASNFFAAESPMGPPPRPGSALSRNGSSGNSRPSTSDGGFVKPSVFSTTATKAPVSAKPAARTSLGGFGFTPNGGRRSVSTSFSTKLQSSSMKAVVPPSPRATSPSKPVSMAQKSKTFSARPTKPRPALGDAFAPVGQSTKAPPARAKPSTASSPANSSATLRQQIAAAKAAARKEREKGMIDSPQDTMPTTTGAYEYDISADPFNTAPKDGKHMLRTRVNAARMSGKLNIAAMELKTIPSEVMHMFDAAAMEESKVNWAEVVDLTKFIAADNELEEIEADVFPDTSVDDFNMDDDAQGNQFGGLELLDLHGNSLSNIPLGLRRLERLTSLNLTHNKLDNSVLEVVSQIKPLKELKLGNNNISGHLPASICELTHLETLELQANRLLALPETLRELVHLRVLNISGNQLTALPMDALQQLPLTDLDASSNALIGSLFPLGGASEHLTLRSLNISNNSLAALTFSASVNFPQLRTLNITNNHLTGLPPVIVWLELITLAAGDNKLSELPEGFTELTRLRNVNFSGNNLHILPPQVANMEALESLVLASNPLRDRKYLTMSAADIKRDLRARLEPEELEAEEFQAMDAGENGFGASPSSGQKWTVGANGLLDLSSQGLADDIDARLAVFLSENPVRQLLLQNNKFTRIPSALTLASDLTILDLSNNPLSSDDYLSEVLELPKLTSIRLTSCRLASLELLLAFLSAPNLQALDLTANALSGPLPDLRKTFPALTTLLASDNKFSSLFASSLRGLTTVNLASNELQSLPPEIGLLWEEGLRNFEVGRNAFRVPGWRVLEKGTEGLLRWLRGRLPDAGEKDWD